MLLRHIHVGLTKYTTASRLQQNLVSAFLAHKANPALNPAPQPTVLTAEFRPVYTCGRREVGTVSEAQKAFLTEQTPWGRAEFHEALRGGQTTFHGPGQLIAYPILDLKTHSLTPRCYIHALESAVMGTCAHYGVYTMRTDNPGVWANDDEKICAVGVHLRRNITSHGIGLNVSTELGWFRRIVGCGLEGKGTTSLEREGVKGVGVEQVGVEFVRQLVKGMSGIEGIEKVDSLSGIDDNG
ncbi:hypothetical protein LTR10_011412 [Elasticomyces elasticus]|nr:hypothetical protein LTR10_011412 [Elasticomyces elasticus]KAK4966177.1 hypothetical protein LTR42_011338 [Elasticomyces elasticus]